MGSMSSKQGNILRYSKMKMDDSTVFLHLKVDPIYIDSTIATIRAGEIYRDEEFQETQDGIYTHNYQTMNGCDSILMLHLTVKDSISIWLPNSFTPVQKHNNIF